MFSFCFHRTNLLYQDSLQILPDNNGRFFEKNKSTVEITGYTLANGWQIGMQSLVFRKSFVGDLDIPEFKYFRDVHLLTHLLNASNGVCMNFFGSVYRIHENGVHSRTSKSESLRVGFFCFDELYKHYRKDYLKLSRSNYLHELIRLSIDNQDFRISLFYIKELMNVDFQFKVLAYYIKEIVKTKFHNWRSEF